MKFLKGKIELSYVCSLLLPSFMHSGLSLGMIFSQFQKMVLILEMERSALHMWNSTGQAYSVWYCEFHATLWALMAADLSLWDWAVWVSIQKVRTIFPKLWCYIWFSMFITSSSVCCDVFLEWLVCFLCILSGWWLHFQLHYFYKNDMETIISYMCTYLYTHNIIYIVNWWHSMVYSNKKINRFLDLLISY